MKNLESFLPPPGAYGSPPWRPGHHSAASQMNYRAYENTGLLLPGETFHKVSPVATNSGRDTLGRAPSGLSSHTKPDESTLDETAYAAEAISSEPVHSSFHGEETVKPTQPSKAIANQTWEPASLTTDQSQTTTTCEDIPVRRKERESSKEKRQRNTLPNHEHRPAKTRSKGTSGEKSKVKETRQRNDTERDHAPPGTHSGTTLSTQASAPLSPTILNTTIPKP